MLNFYKPIRKQLIVIDSQDERFKTMQKYKSIDLFAGIGGIRLGFDRAFGENISTVFISEWDEQAKKTYASNFKDNFEIAGDITKINEEMIPQFDICLAGFPCQPFSIAGNKQGFNDSYKGLCRGTLFQDVARICEYHKPKVIFCENVKGLVSHDRGRTFKIICKAFEEIGYKVFYKVLNSKDFGVPQNRERIYIVAFRNDISPNTFDFPNPTNDKVRIRDIIEKEPVPAKYYLSDVYLNTLVKHKKRHASKGNGFGYEIREWDGIAGTLVCGGMGRERNLLVDKRQKNLKPTTHIKGEINKDGVRKMTPREWARLQGFPDSFKFVVADVHLYRQFGNSVTVNVIEEIAKKIKKVLIENEDKDMNKLSGNKGEWSEIYAFLRLLETGKLYAADSELNVLDNTFFNIIEIIRSDKRANLEFKINREEETISVLDGNDKKLILKRPRAVFQEMADKLYEYIVNQTVPSKELIDIQEFLELLNIGSLKAKSTDKADIRLKIHDINSGYEKVQGFSIKSQLGNPSTLVNAGKTTNFIYEISGNIDDKLMEKFNESGIKKIKDKIINFLLSSNCSIRFMKMQNEIFENNLKLIDSDLPEICAYMILEYYKNGTALIKKSIDVLKEENPLHYDLSYNHPYYEYKIKRFLSDCALGLYPSKIWDGTADATGGYIIVSKEGNVLCYHLFNRNEFENYLINNSRFETGSTHRHDFGKIYKENGKYFMKLNLQIRFIK